LGASLFFIKNLLKISLFGKERKFKGPKKVKAFSAINAKNFSLYQREKKIWEISQI